MPANARNQRSRTNEKAATWVTAHEKTRVIGAHSCAAPAAHEVTFVGAAYCQLCFCVPAAVFGRLAAAFDALLVELDEPPPADAFDLPALAVVRTRPFLLS